MSKPAITSGEVPHDKKEKRALCVRFDYDIDLLDRVRVAAKVNHVSVSTYVRSIIREYFKQK